MNKLTKEHAPFTQVPNELLTDTTLSLKAKGLYALMYSKPDNWTFYETALAKESRDGKDAVSAGLDELMKAGWLKRSGGRQEGTNRFCAYDYELMVSRSGISVTENPSRESRHGKPATNNTQGSKKEENSPQPPKGAVGWESDPLFGKVCDAYAKLNPSRVDTSKAWSVWLEKNLTGQAQHLLSVLPTFAATDQWKKEGGKFIPSLSKWLANGAWRNASIAKQVSMEELSERERISKAGVSAWGRVETDRKYGRDPSPDDLVAVDLWQRQQASSV